MVVVIIGWIIFRADNFSQAIEFIRNLFVYKENIGYTVASFVNIEQANIIVLSIIIAVVIPLLMKKKIFVDDSKCTHEWEMVLCTGIMGVSLVMLICDTYNPFIYFRF